MVIIGLLSNSSAMFSRTECVDFAKGCIGVKMSKFAHATFFKNMFYQLLCVPHSSSSTQSWGSVLPSIVEKRDQNLPPSLSD